MSIKYIYQYTDQYINKRFLKILDLPGTRLFHFVCTANSIVSSSYLLKKEWSRLSVQCNMSLIISTLESSH